MKIDFEKKHPLLGKMIPETESEEMLSPEEHAALLKLATRLVRLVWALVASAILVIPMEFTFGMEAGTLRTVFVIAGCAGFVIDVVILVVAIATHRQFTALCAEITSDKNSQNG